MSVIVSGMRPTGRLHLGHLHGALRNWIRLQTEHRCYFFVADWHALTSDPEHTGSIVDNSREMVLDWLAADPATAKALVGTYNIEGKNAQGKEYTGTVEIEHVKGSTVRLTYKFGKRNDIGTGEVDGNTLTVTYEAKKTDREGKATYRIQKDGDLVGRWKDKGGKPGEETLTRRKGKKKD